VPTLFPRSMFCSLLVIVIGGCGGSRQAPADKPIDIVGAPNTAKSGERSAIEGSNGKLQELKFDRIQFTAPAGWKQVDIPPEKRNFIDGQLSIPVDGETLTLTLSSIGGGIDANVERWKTQFEPGPDAKPVVEPIDVGNRKGTWVDLQGTFQGSMGAGGPQSGWRMLGVCIPDEPRDFYLKLTGPAATVEKVRQPLRDFVATARFTL
jgi:hypothetical protein